MQETAFPIDPVKILNNGWKPTVIITLIFVLLAGTLQLAWPDKYEATAVITVAPVTESSGAVNMDTERVVARSDSVLNTAAEELADSSTSALRERLTVNVPKGSNILQFTVSDSDAERAAQSANAIAKAYGNNRTSSAQAVTDAAMESITTRIAELEDQMSSTSNDVDERAIELQLNSLQERLAGYSATTYNPSSIVSTAVAPSSSTTPSLTIFLAGGFFVGILISLTFVFGRERFRAARQWNRQAESRRLQDVANS